MRSTCEGNYENGSLPTIADAHTPAWDQGFRTPPNIRYDPRKCIGMNCHPLAGSESRTFSADCTMNTGSRKLRHKARSTFCGRQVRRTLADHFSSPRRLTLLTLRGAVGYGWLGKTDTP